MALQQQPSNSKVTKVQCYIRCAQKWVKERREEIWQQRALAADDDKIEPHSQIRVIKMLAPKLI
jgi:hypothetical protein